MRKQSMLRKGAFMCLIAIIAMLVVGGKKTQLVAASSGFDILNETETSSINKGDSTSTSIDGSESQSKSTNSKLKILSVDTGKLSPEFSPETTKYTLNIDEQVESVSVTCSVADTKAVVIEAGGFKSLNVGNNDAIVKVQAEDGSTTTYEITIVRGGETDSTQESEEEGEESDTTDMEAGISLISMDADKIPIGGETIFASFEVNNIFDESLLPNGFELEEYNYKGTDVWSAYFVAGDLRLLYLTAGDGTSGDFRIYYENIDEFMDFIQLSTTDDKFVVPIMFSAQAKIPDQYTDSFLPWGDKVIPCYIYSELDDTATNTEIEFYLLCCVNNEGEEGFYLYDSIEGTYQRYVERDTSYELDQSYFKYKDMAHTRFAINCILGVLLLIAVFIIINLLIKNHELKVDKAETSDEEDETTADEMVVEETEKKVVKPEAKPESKPESKPEPEIEEMEISVREDESEDVKESDDLEDKIIQQVSHKQAEFKMINLTREPENSDLDDDFEFEFINLDDD